MNTKGILMSILMIGVVAMAAGAGTFAYFSDVETSSGNTFTAGTLNLQVGANDTTTEKISISDLKPGDSGNAATWLVKNTGNLDGKLSIDIGPVTNYENTRTEPEEEAGDNTTGDTDGELGAYLRVAIWLDMDKDGKWDAGEKYLKSDGAVVTASEDIADANLPSEAYDYLNSFSGKSYSADTLGVTIAGNTEMGNFRVEYDFPSAADDDKTQSDSAEFDITFTLSQA